MQSQKNIGKQAVVKFLKPDKETLDKLARFEWVEGTSTKGNKFRYRRVRPSEAIPAPKKSVKGMARFAAGDTSPARDNFKYAPMDSMHRNFRRYDDTAEVNQRIPTGGKRIPTGDGNPLLTPVYLHPEWTPSTDNEWKPADEDTQKRGIKNWNLYDKKNDTLPYYYRYKLTIKVFWTGVESGFIFYNDYDEGWSLAVMQNLTDHEVEYNSENPTLVRFN